MNMLLSSLIAPYAALVVVAIVAYMSTCTGQNHITGRYK